MGGLRNENNEILPSDGLVDLDLCVSSPLDQIRSVGGEGRIRLGLSKQRTLDNKLNDILFQAVAAL